MKHPPMTPNSNFKDFLFDSILEDSSHHSLVKARKEIGMYLPSLF